MSGESPRERNRSRLRWRSWHHGRHDDEPKGPCRVGAQDTSGPASPADTGHQVRRQASTACLRARCPRSSALSTLATICSRATSARLCACGRTTSTSPSAICGTTTSGATCTGTAAATLSKPAFSSTPCCGPYRLEAPANSERSSAGLTPSGTCRLRLTTRAEDEEHTRLTPRTTAPSRTFVALWRPPDARCAPASAVNTLGRRPRRRQGFGRGSWWPGSPSSGPPGDQWAAVRFSRRVPLRRVIGIRSPGASSSRRCQRPRGTITAPTAPARTPPDGRGSARTRPARLRAAAPHVSGQRLKHIDERLAEIGHPCFHEHRFEGEAAADHASAPSGTGVGLPRRRPAVTPSAEISTAASTSLRRQAPQLLVPVGRGAWRYPGRCAHRSDGGPSTTRSPGQFLTPRPPRPHSAIPVSAGGHGTF